MITKNLYSVLVFDEDIYTSSSMFVKLLDNLTLPFILLLLVPLVLFRLKWRDIIASNFTYIKYFILVILSIWAWKIITLDFNLYFNQAYHIDRVILVSMFILAFRYPFVIIYFLIFSLIFYMQINYPYLEYQFPRAYNNPRLLIEILILFSIYMLGKRFYKNTSILAFFIVVIIFHASNYFIPGIGKIWISEHYVDWIWSNDLSNILAARHFNGWLEAIIPSQDIGAAVSLFHRIAIPMQIFAFLIQFLVLFVFFNKRFSLLLFFSFELLHIGVFLVSGIFFWAWIFVNLAIVYVLNKLTIDEEKMIFNYKTMLLSFSFILLGNHVFHSSVLAWYDTALNNSYKIYVTTENKERYRVDTNLFAPYEQVFYYDSLTYGINKRTSPYWDTQSQLQNEEIKELSNKKDISSLAKNIFDIEEKYDKNEFNLEKQERLKKFLKQYFLNYNKIKDKRLIWSSLAPPKHSYLAFDWDKKSKLNSKVKKIEIIYYKTFYSHYYNKVIKMEEEKILDMEI